MSEPFSHLPAAEFSLVSGGPFFRLMKFIFGGLEFPMSTASGAVVGLTVWLPLLILSATERQFLSNESVSVPFLLDFEVHTRFLLALPLLIITEGMIHKRTRVLIIQFFERGLVKAETEPAFWSVVNRAIRLRNSTLAEILLVVGVYIIGQNIWRNYITLDSATWYAVPPTTGSRLSLGGLFFIYVSLPIFQFILLRWFYRLFIWALFLFNISRLDLEVTATHPDRLGGLGFIPSACKAYGWFAAAVGSLLTGWMATRIVFDGSRLADFTEAIFLVVIFVLCVVLGPLMSFFPLLQRTERSGRRIYGTLASRYVQKFESKWVSGPTPPTEEFVGSSDIQSLADLGNSYNLVASMRVIPVTFELVKLIVFATLLPMGPLLLTMMPLRQLINELISILL